MSCPPLARISLVLGILMASPTPKAESVYIQDVRFALDRLEQECGHFFELKKINWKEVRTRFLEEARLVKSDSEHLVLLSRLLARVKDGHAKVVRLERGEGVEWPSEGEGRRVGPGMFLCRIKQKIYVKNSWSSAEGAGVKAGSQVLRVDGKPVARWLSDLEEELSDRISFSTDQHRFFNACHWGLMAPPGTRMKLEVKEPDGKKKKRTVTYSGKASGRPGPAYPPTELQHTKDFAYGKTESGFGYVYLRRCPGDFPEQMDVVLGALGDLPGLILDFRGNTGGGFDHDALMGRFIPRGEELEFVKRYASAGPHPYGGPVVVIVDGTVVSAGETASGIFKEDGRAYLIGESPTAGMSSQKTTIELPSRLFGLYVSVRSNKARFNQGKGIEGIGVIPHALVEYEPKDLAKGVDTLIAKAERLLGKFPQNEVPYDPSKFGWKQ